MRTGRGLRITGLWFVFFIFNSVINALIIGFQLRFWKGSGFGYRYSKPPNSTDKLGQPLNKDQNSLNNLSQFSFIY